MRPGASGPGPPPPPPEGPPPPCREHMARITARIPLHQETRRPQSSPPSSPPPTVLSQSRISGQSEDQPEKIKAPTSDLWKINFYCEIPAEDPLVFHFISFNVILLLILHHHDYYYKSLFSVFIVFDSRGWIPMFSLNVCCVASETTLAVFMFEIKSFQRVV